MTRKPRHLSAAALRTAGALLASCVLCAGADALATKPTAPIRLTARVVATDPLAGTAHVEVVARALVKAHTVAVQCRLPKGAAVVPGTGGWQRTQRPGQGQRVLRLCVALPPHGGPLIVSAELKGPTLRIGRIVKLDLPPARGQARKAAGKTPRLLKTNRGERLRLHK